MAVQWVSGCVASGGYTSEIEGDSEVSDYIPTQPAQVVHGLPPAGDLTSATIDQGYPDTCAIRSQEIILRDFGINMTQEQLVHEANDHGWYSSGGGTPADDVGKLLELHGVGMTRYDHANVYNLVSELSAGKRIIVGVDSGELWNPGISEQMEDSILGERPDHALIVAGVDTSDPNNVKVVLTDPGTGHIAKEYPLEKFMDAWKDSGFMMVSTNSPAPATASGMANFDYSSGHLPIGEMSYEAWSDQYDYLMAPATYASADLDGDGIIDAVQMDTDHNGIDDLAMADINGDGNVDILGLDVTGDGVLDVVVAQIPGTDIFQVAFDTNGDGIVDGVATDLDGDGQIDVYGSFT